MTDDTHKDLLDSEQLKVAALIAQLRNERDHLVAQDEASTAVTKEWERCLAWLDLMDPERARLMATHHQGRQMAVTSNEDRVRAWNNAHPVGAAVHVVRDDGLVSHDKTTAPASILAGGTIAVIWLEKLGCSALVRVSVVDDA